MSNVRHAPVRAVFKLHPQNTRGICRWCGLVTTETTPRRGQLRHWHKSCEAEYLLCIRPDQARWQVEKRDHGICCDCGEDWSERYRFSKGASVIVSEREDRDGARAGFYRYTEVLWVSLWHVDHKIPLWKVAHLPDLQRIDYFKLANLVTRCHVCHQFKTTEEAAERAHHKRLSEPKKEPKFKRPIPHRGFGSGSRKLGGRKLGAKTVTNVKQLNEEI